MIFFNFDRRPADLPYRPAAMPVVRYRFRASAQSAPEDFILMGENGLGKGLCDIPQGGIDPGETVEVAAARELLEETGLQRVADVRHQQTGANTYFYDFPLNSRQKPGFRGQKLQAVLFYVDSEADPEWILNKSIRHSRRFVRLHWFAPQEVLQRAHNDTNGHSISFQKQAIYAGVLEDFGLLQAPVPVATNRLRLQL